MGATVLFGSNGKTASGYIAHPADASGPGVIVIQEWWGLVPHIKDVADRLAAEGFVALAPDLFHGEVTREPDEGAKLMMALDLERAAKEMAGAVDYLNALPTTTGKTVGAIGFCMGGGLVLWLSTIKPEGAACVPFYGAIPWEDVQPDFSAARASYLGHYATKDDWATQESARQIQTQLQALGREANFHFYEGTHHAFFNDTRPEVYDRTAAELAWQRTISFLRAKL